MSKKRRAHGRIRIQGLAAHVSGPDGILPGLLVENLSLGGAFIRTAHPLPRGTPVQIDLVKPGLSKAIRLQARVVSAVSPSQVQAAGQHAGMGVAFHRLDGELPSRLQTFLTMLAPQPELLEGDFLPEDESADGRRLGPGQVAVHVDAIARARRVLAEWQAHAKRLEEENAALKAELERLRDRHGKG